jgi:hypothetical protein
MMVQSVAAVNIDHQPRVAGAHRREMEHGNGSYGGVQAGGGWLRFGGNAAEDRNRAAALAWLE